MRHHPSANESDASQNHLTISLFSAMLIAACSGHPECLQRRTDSSGTVQEISHLREETNSSAHHFARSREDRPALRQVTSRITAHRQCSRDSSTDRIDGSYRRSTRSHPSSRLRQRRRYQCRHPDYPTKLHRCTEIWHQENDAGGRNEDHRGKIGTVTLLQVFQRYLTYRKDNNNEFLLFLLKQLFQEKVAFQRNRYGADRLASSTETTIKIFEDDLKSRVRKPFLFVDGAHRYRSLLSGSSVQRLGSKTIRRIALVSFTWVQI
jgi:hypothetical protein